MRSKRFRFIVGVLLMVLLVSSGTPGTAFAGDESDGFDYVGEGLEPVIGPNWDDLIGRYGEDVFAELEDWCFIAEQIESTVEQVEEEWAPVIEHHEYIAAADLNSTVTRQVSNWAELRAAVADVSVSHITFTNSITRSTVANEHLANINRDLTINGNGHTLDLGGNNNRAFILERRPQETFFSIENLRFTNMRMDYVVIHNDTSSAGTHAGRFTENWVIQLHNVDHVEEQTPAALVKAQNSEIILTGNIRWNTINPRNSTAAGSTTGLIVVRGVTITNNANVDLQARHIVFNINPSARNFETFFVVSGDATVNLYSRERSTIWMNRGRNANNPVFFLVTGEGTVLNASSDGAGSGQANGVISIAGGNPNVEDSSAIIINNGARLYVNSLRQVGSGTRGMPAFISRISSGTFNIMGEGTRVELNSVGGDNTHGAVLTFPSLGQQNLNVVNRAELVVNRLPGASTASAIRFQGEGNTFNVYSYARVVVNSTGNGNPNNTANSALHFTRGGAMHIFLGGSVELYAHAGPAVRSNANWFQFTTIGVRDRSTFIARGRTSGPAGGAITTELSLMLLFDNAAEYDIANLRPGGGRVFNVNGLLSVLAVVNSDLQLWAHGSDVNAEATQQWPRMDFMAAGPSYILLQESSYAYFTREVLGENGFRDYSRIRGGLSGAPIPLDDLIEQINRSPSFAQSNDFSFTTWERFEEARVVAEFVRWTPNPPRAIVADATNNLRVAIDGLVNIRNLRIEVGISESIRLAGQPEGISHTDWNQFNLLLSRAGTVLANPNPGQRQVDEAFNNLRNLRERLGLEGIGTDVNLAELWEEIERSNTIIIAGRHPNVPLTIWLDFLASFEQAERIYYDVTSTQDDVDGAKQTLANVRLRVEEEMARPTEVDFTELRAEIERSAAIFLSGQPAGVTPQSWSSFVFSYGQAQLVYANHLATQEEVDNARITLALHREQVQEEAGHGTPVDLSGLIYELVLSEAVYAAGRPANVTLHVWNGFVFDLRLARATVENDAVTQTQVDIVTTALTNSRLRVTGQ